MSTTEIPKAQVTTTDSVQGLEIETYLGPVVISLVAGAGLVTEFFAGLSDVFGGRSASVASRLAELYADAAVELRRAAARVGANWILGYRVDFDEISGKGTMMFMLTASGTAVRARRGTSTAVASGPDAVTATDVATAAKRLALLVQPSANTLADESIWRFAIENRVSELAGPVLDWLATEYSRSDPGRYALLRVYPVEFFAAISAEKAVSALYHGLNVGHWYVLASLDLMRDLALLDLERTLKLLQTDNPEVRRLGLQTMRAHQGTYSRGSVAQLDAILKLVAGSFPDLAPTKEVKGLFGSKTVWICRSGHDVAISEPVCDSCGADRRGFRRGDLTPEEALLQIRSTRDAVSFALRSDVL